MHSITYRNAMRDCDEAVIRAVLNDHVEARTMDEEAGLLWILFDDNSAAITRREDMCHLALSPVPV